MPLAALLGRRRQRGLGDLKYDPFLSQKKFHDLGDRFKGFSGPVGSGKSKALCYEALRLAYENPGLPGLIGAPTYPLLRDVTRAIFLEVLDENNIPHQLHKAVNVISLPECGSEVLFRTLEHPERLRGTNLAWFGVDEASYCKEQSWLRLEARLRHPRASRLCGFGAWTPKGFDWVYGRFIGEEKLDGYGAVVAKPFENVALPADFYDRLKGSYDERFYEQEVLGKYLNVFAGQVYWAFDRDTQVGDYPYNPQQPLYWSLDFNVNPMCSLLAQPTDAGEIRVIDELALPNSSVQQACEEFRLRTEKLTEKWGQFGRINVYLFGDSTGARRAHASPSCWKIIEQFFRDNGDAYRMTKRVPASNPLVKDRVNTVNGALRNTEGDSRVFLDRKCKELIKDLEQIAWKSDPNGRTLNDIDNSDGMRTHTSDAFGYMLWQEMGIRARVGYSSMHIA